jgi:hypothetical protein
VEEASLRIRVNRIKKEDPQFYKLMLDWRDEFNRRRKLWDDKLMLIPMFDPIRRKIVNRPFTIDNAITMIQDQLLDDEGWEYSYVD